MKRGAFGGKVDIFTVMDFVFCCHGGYQSSFSEIIHTRFHSNWAEGQHWRRHPKRCRAITYYGGGGVKWIRSGVHPSAFAC